jgi:hypothetical protein
VTCAYGRNLYLSWFQDLPYTLSDNTYYKISQSDLTSEPGNAATITIAVFPGMLSLWDTCAVFGPETFSDDPNQSSTANSANPLGVVGEGSSMIQCQLFNSTYKADFMYTDGGQSTIVSAPVKSSDKTLTTFDYVGQRLSKTLTECFGLHNTSGDGLELDLLEP